MNPQEIQKVKTTIDQHADALMSVTLVYDGKTETIVAAPLSVPKPAPTVTRIVQGNDKYAFDISKGDFTLSDTVVTQGGLVRFKSKGGTLRLNRVWSEGAPGVLGVYFVLVATEPAKLVVWDNTGAPDRWICGGPDSGGRFMGGGKELHIINVDFVTRLHAKGDDAGKKLAPVPQLHPLKQPAGNWTEWKQNPQVRDFETVTMQGTLPNADLPDGQGRIVGLLDIGSQAAPLQPQHVGQMTIKNYGLEHFPHLTDEHSYGTVKLMGCFKIDGNGKAIRDGKGNLAMWPDKTWRGR